MKKNKTYTGVMKLHKDLSKEDLEREMEKFVGKIIQLPPVKSRVKRQEREREVYSWNLLEYDKEKKEVLFECEVEAGTYVRKMISDLGLKIGGAHMLELRRTKAGIFQEEDENFISLYELEKLVKENKLKQILIPAEEAIKKIMPAIQVKNETVEKLLTGKPIFKEDLANELKIKEGDVAVFCRNEKFVGVYRIVKEGDIILRPEWVFN